MILRRRILAVVIPLGLYCVSGAAAGYFVWHAVNGERGLKAKAAYRAQIRQLDSDLVAAKAERATWEHRVTMMRADSIDRDLLDEETRAVLGRVGKDDAIILIPKT